jgi:hypothetical protein
MVILKHVEGEPLEPRSRRCEVEDDAGLSPPSPCSGRHEVVEDDEVEPL